MEIICVFFLSFVALSSGADLAWNYYGENSPDKWADSYPECAAEFQSPINIVTDTVQYNNDLEGFSFSDDWDVPASDLTLSNNGHTATVSVEGLSADVSDGSIGGTHRLAQFHFHWGMTDYDGSEHQLNGNKYSEEVHFVTYNLKYGSVANAADKPDGLAVLGFFIEITPTDNPAFQYIIQHLTDVSHIDESYVLEPMSIGSLLPTDLNFYYRYQGSLTTPPCYQSVVWSVFEKTIKMSSSQVAAFRDLWEDKEETHHIDFNFRPPQPLNGRQVWSNNAIYGPTKSAATCWQGMGLIQLAVLAVAAMKLIL